MNKNKNNKGKELRKPVSNNFSPKRLAISFEPPMLSNPSPNAVIEYLVVDTGKLYHHKIRLDSVLRKPKVARDDLLNYVKTKHHLYFANGKIKDAQLYKFIDKILSRRGVTGPQPAPPTNPLKIPTNSGHPQDLGKEGADDFDYLNDKEE
jgi:hypothetical protein